MENKDNKNMPLTKKVFLPINDVFYHCLGYDMDVKPKDFLFVTTSAAEEKTS